MAARREASPLPTVKLLHSRDKPTGRPQRANGRLALVEVLQEASELLPPVTLLATALPVLVAPLQRVRGLVLPVTLLATGLPVLAAPPQRVNEPQLPVRRQVAGLPVAEVRVPSEAAPVDTTALALAPPAAAVPPAWDLAEAEASAAEVAVVGADEQVSTSFLLLASGERLETRSGG